MLVAGVPRRCLLHTVRRTCLHVSVFQLIDWKSKDEKLIHAVKKGSVQTVRRLISGKSPAHPVKLDPTRGSTACVSLLDPFRIINLPTISRNSLL